MPLSQWTKTRVEMARRPDGSVVAVEAQLLAEARADNDEHSLASAPPSAQADVEKQDVEPFRPPAVRFDHPGTVLVPSGAKSRARANLAALAVVKECERENRFATAEEQQVLSAWSGWGAVKPLFDPNRQEWAGEREQLRSLLTGEEYENARASVLSAHYTDPAIAAAMWRALGDAGFDGGRVLEPGCGSGTFMSLAPDDAVMVGVEKDPVSAQIAHLLNPDAQVRLEGFEVTSVPDASFAATIGNVPFGGFEVPDPIHNPRHHTIHNAFLLKSLHLTAPGGWVVAITTASTMDSTTTRAREDLAAVADLVGAVRLPNSAFKAVAGTKVGTDILVFRRREESRPVNDRPEWVETRMVEMLDREGNQTALPINSYFDDHPGQILGTMSVGHGLHRDNELRVTVEDGTDIAAGVNSALGRVVTSARLRGLTHQPAMIAEDMSNFDAGIASAAELYLDQIVVGTVRYNQEHAQFEQYADRGEGEGGSQWSWSPVKVAKSRVAETRSLLGLRDIATALLASQGEDSAPLAERNALRAQLNSAYENYVARYGPLNRFREMGGRERTDSEVRERMAMFEARWRRDNGSGRFDDAGEPVLDDKGKPVIDPYVGEIPVEARDLFEVSAWEPTPVQVRRDHLLPVRSDPHMQVVLALENFDEDAFLAGDPDRPAATKTSIFSRDVVVAPQRATTADTPQDAVAISLAETGRVDVERVAELLDVNADVAREQLRGHAFIAVDGSGDLVAASHLLSGNVREKAVAARDLMAGARDDQVREDYLASAAALEDAIPRDLQPDEIGIVKPGVTWVAGSDYADFVREVLGGGENVKVQRGAGKWTVNARLASVDDAKFFTEFGAPNDDSRKDRSAGQLLEALLNQEPVEIRNSKDAVENGAPPVDAEQTLVCRVQSEKIAAEFAQWVWSDPDRTTRLMRTYNDRFNSWVPGRYDGTHLAFPGLNPQFTPHPYQRDAVARTIVEPTVLLDHVVGAGKTGTMMMSAMELKRRGLATQPWLVVPTHLIEQISREAKQWYPAARILAGRKGMDDGDRRMLVAQTATAEWDLVIVPASVFEAIPTQPGRQQEYIRAQLSNLERELQSPGLERRTVAQIEGRKAVLNNRLTKLMKGKRSKDTGLYFEQTGCDYLLVDEAHSYKNKSRECAIEALSHPGSQKAENLSLKLDYLRDRAQQRAAAEGRSVPRGAEKVALFATGTPIANSLAEAWVMQSYMRPDVLATARVESVTDWAATFTKTRSETITNSTGTRLQVVSRVSSYNNAKAMYALAQQFTDVVTRDQVPANLPTFGERQMVVTEPGQAVRDFIGDLEYRTDNPPQDARLDNPLKVLNDGRNAALDPRLVGLMPEPGTTRADAVATSVASLYHLESTRTYLTDDRSAPARLPGSLQLVFCDRGTPKANGGWSVYQELKEQLIARDVPESEIRFIHDAKTDSARLKLFEDCKSGRVRVLVGSTEKMGTGMNVQTRLSALHHMDVPWRPADLEQREGRIIRQGNQNESVSIFAYATAGTTDTVMWGKVESKARFIEEYKLGQLSNTDDVPEIDDESLASAAAATKAAATGDQRFIQMVELEDEVNTLTALEAAHRDTEAHARRTIIQLDREIPALEAEAAHLDPLASGISAWEKSGKQFGVMTWRGEVREFEERPDRSVALLERAQATWGELSGQGAMAFKPIAQFPSGVRLEMSRPMDSSAAYLRLNADSMDRPVSAGLVSSTTLQRGAKITPAGASGFTARVENAYSKLAAQPDNLRHDVTDKTRQRELLLPRVGTVFEHADALRNKRVELQQIKDAIRVQSQSPEAIAAREAATQRLLESGRRRGWSLEWNPTQFMLESSDVGTVEEYRMAVHDMERGRARSYAAEQRTPPARADAHSAANLARRGTAEPSSVNRPAAPPNQPTPARRPDVGAHHTSQREETQR